MLGPASLAGRVRAVKALGTGIASEFDLPANPVPGVPVPRVPELPVPSLREPDILALGPYRWVRNPMYIGVLLIVVGQAWLFLAQALLVYALVLAIVVHPFVIGYEEPALRDQFGQTYDEYRRSVSRWIPRRP